MIPNQPACCPICGRPFSPPSVGSLERGQVCSHCSDARLASPGEPNAEDADVTQMYPVTSDPTVAGQATEPSSAEHPTSPAVDATLDLPPLLATTSPHAHQPLGGAVSSRTKTHVGRFVVRSVLGKGAFGTVYLAYDPVLDREVALKTPRFSDDDAMSCERFLREAKAAAKLRHPNIVAVFESGEADGEPFIASEYVDGTVLSTLLKRKTVDLPTTVDWIRQVAEGLDYAHSEGIVHRDIKPGNMMISRSGRPQIMDFGLAKRSEEGAAATTEGTIVGTPAYMSPEQARGQQASVGHASDQYSVGVVFYEMLCGRTPYVGDAWSVVSQVSSAVEMPPAPRALQPGVPRDLEACCLKALEKDPAARYPSLKEFAADLERWLNGQPLLARPISVWEKLQRWRRRNKLAAALLTAIATIVVVAGIAGYVLAFQFRELAAAAKRDAVAAKKAQEMEAAARRSEQQAQLVTQRMLIDSYAISGGSADRNHDTCEAALWFANAAALAENHPDRRRLNHIRLQSWSANLALPIYAFHLAGHWCEALRYHPSGRYLLCESLTAECEIRDLSDGSVFPLPLAGPIQCGVWSPDGARLALASEANLSLRDFPSGDELRSWDYRETIHTCGFSGDGRRIAVGGDQYVQVFDVSSGKALCAELSHDRPLLAAHLNRDGSRLATVSEDRVVRVFAVTNVSEGLAPVLPPQELAVSGKETPFLFLGDDRIIIPEGRTGLNCWNTRTGEIVWHRKASSILSLAASPNEAWVAVGGFPEAVILDAATGEPRPDKIKHRNMVHDLAFSPDSKLLLSGSSDNTARVSRVSNGEPFVAPIPHYDAVHRCVWSPDGQTIATVHWGDRLVRVWKLGGDPARDFQAPENLGSMSLKLNADQTLYFPTGMNDDRRQNSLQVRSTNDGREIGQPIAWPGLISDASFVPNSTLIALGGSRDRPAAPDTSLDKQNLEQEGIVRFHDYQTGLPRFEALTTPSEPIAIEASPNGRTIVALCFRGQVVLIDGQRGTQRAAVQAFQGHPANFRYVVRDRIRFSPSGEQFAIWGTGRRWEVRRSQDGELLFAGEHRDNFVHDVRFSPDGARFVSCSSDGTARLWNSKSGELEAELPHGGWVFCAKFSRDGKRLLTASRDGQARLWDLDRRQVITATTVQGDEVFAVCFSRDERFFFLATRDHQISVWDVATGSLAGPIRHCAEPAHELALNAAGTHLLAAGQSLPVLGIEIQAWIREPDLDLSTAELRMLGEIFSSKRIYESGAATALSRLEWHERWKHYQQLQPRYPALRAPRLLESPKPSPKS